MTWIPHGKYPQGKPFNVLKMTPGVFKGISLEGFLSVLGGDRFHDFLDSQLFLYSSQSQENYGAKLVMLLSAVERLPGKNKDSVRSVKSFYKNNLLKTEKERIIRSVKLMHVFKGKKASQGVIFEPVTPKRKQISTEADLNVELGKAIKKVIYDIRNAFVHKATYIPFPDRQYLQDRKLFLLTKGGKGGPKETWAITMPFENFHQITTDAFCRFWREEYTRRKNQK